jgi:flagellar biosynthetic protein FliO
MFNAKQLSFVLMAVMAAALACLSVRAIAVGSDAAQAVSAVSRPVVPSTITVAQDVSRAHLTNTTNKVNISPKKKAVGIGSDFFASLDQPDVKPAKPDDSLASTAIWFVVKLALVVALAYCGILGLKKFNGLKVSPLAGGRSMRVKEQVSLGPGRMLQIVEIGERHLLLGSTASQISLITELDSSDIHADALSSTSGGFREQLSAFLGNKQGNIQTAKSVAQMLRETTAGIQDKVRQVNLSRGNLRAKDDE